MGAILNSTTGQALAYHVHPSVESNTVQSSQGLLGRFISWERSTSSSCCPSTVKTWIIFFVNRCFVILDACGIGRMICNDGLVATKNSYMLRQIGSEHNLNRTGTRSTPSPAVPAMPRTADELWLTRAGRSSASCERVVEALGGLEACRSIPIVSLQPAELRNLEPLPDLLLINRDAYFPEGQWKIQGEDPYGRKFVALRLKQKDTQFVHFVTIRQRCSETEIERHAGNINGETWYINSTPVGRPDAYHHFGSVDLEEALEMVRDLRVNGSCALIPPTSEDRSLVIVEPAPRS